MKSKPIISFPQGNRERLSLFSHILPWIFLAGTFCIAVLFQLRYGEYFLNSDMAAEMLLAKELNDSGSLLFAKNWFYSTEIRALYQHIPFRLGLLLFPDNWHLARVLGQAIMLALHAASFISLMSAAGYKKAGIYGAAALMLPFGYWYLFHGIFSGAYLTHMILVSASTAMILKLSQNGFTKKTVLQLVLLGVFCLWQGLNGVRMLMNLFLPLLLAVILVFVLRLNKAPLDRKFCKDPYGKIIGITLLATLFCAAGYLVNTKVLSNIYAFKTFNDQVWQPFRFQSLGDTFGKFLALFGYPYEQWQQISSTVGWEEIPLFGISGILGAASIVLMTAVIFASFRLGKLWHKLNFASQVIFALFLSCLAVDGAIYAFLETDLNGSYWLPVVPLAFAVVILWIKNEEFRLPQWYQYCVGLVLLVCIFCTSVSTTLHFIQFPSRTAKGIEKVTQWLVENGYEAGYATFWYSDVITELSDGKIEMWTCSGQEDLSPYEWLQKRDHMDPPEGRFFILLPEFYYDYCQDIMPYPVYEDTVVLQYGSYTVLAYDSYDDLLQ